MNANQFKSYALEIMCEAHRWKSRQQQIFWVGDTQYLATKWDDGDFSLATRRSIYDMWGCPKVYPDINSLFGDIFRIANIAY